MEANMTVEKIVKVLDNKKAEEIKVLKISELTVMADYFIIANGTSNTHVRALAEEVEAELSDVGVEPRSIEGRATGWILLDYSDVVVHVFTARDREYYNLERLWQDGEEIDVSSLISE
ncbi:MAG: ribosome silencing factor [Clostridia bacterium]|nr:ribosome silencing factor [Clostridia bacterium]